MPPINNNNRSIVTTVVVVVVSQMLLTTTVTATVTPTCESLGKSWYFPNDCVSECTSMGGISTMDTDRSRNVNGKIKCYCVGQELPFCTDDPTCADISIFPGTALENCQEVCSTAGTGTGTGTGTAVDVDVLDDVEYAGDPNAANKNQTHFKVSCSCDGGKTQKCGVDYVLFSDLTYLQSCSSSSSSSSSADGENNSLNINSEDECSEYCTTRTNNNGVFNMGEWIIYESMPEQYGCSCLDDDLTTSAVAVACDDTKANFNDASGLGNPCYESVGVNNNIDDCSSTSAPSSAAASMPTAPPTAKTLVSSTAIMGVWLLPW